MRDFMDYLMEAENAQLWKNGEGAVHESPEGGTRTVGFGHKLNLVEQETKQVRGMNLGDLDKEKSVELLKKDLPVYINNLKRRIGPKWDKLSNRSKEMLLDMEYNLGNVSSKFPSFTEAVLKGDLEGQRKEFKRYYKDAKGKTHEIKERNRLFEDRFLTDKALKEWAKAGAE